MLRPEHVLAPLAADTVHGAVAALTRRLEETGAVLDPAKLGVLFSENRIRDIIHVGDRVLLPHLRTDAVPRLVVAIGIPPRPLPLFPRDPAATAQVVVLVLAPPTASGLYLQTVAALARALRHDHVVDRLASARSPEEVLAIPEIGELSIHPRLTVRDVMTPRVHRVSPDTPVRELLELVSTHRLRAVPVVGEEREVLGMVTDRDLLRHLLPAALRPGDAGAHSVDDSRRELRVRDIMSRSVMCVSEDQALAEVASVMVNKDVERLPVVSEGKLTGFLTRGDILRKLFGFRTP
ncbi:MAG TPA: CBS domain-containing protein [Longimicrobiaceae bacterium]|nr:CBS domain-containing protein [Longimicrobiaceae bacterium]